MKTFRVKPNATVKHGGAFHGANTVIEMTDTEAADADLTGLEEIASGAAPAKGDDRQAKIIAAIKGLDPKTKGNFTSAGVPSVEALEKVVGDITAEERDAAWAQVQKDNPDLFKK